MNSWSINLRIVGNVKLGKMLERVALPWEYWFGLGVIALLRYLGQVS